VNEVHLAVEAIFVSSKPATDDQFEEFLDVVVSELENIGRDINLGARLPERYAEFVATIEAEDFESAAAAFLGDLRTALHAAGCSTAGWPDFTPSERVLRELQDA
jgi:hypothetical protein